MKTAHLVCLKTDILAASGTGKTEGHAILAAVTEYSAAVGTRQSWSEIFSVNGEKRDARLFEVFIADGEHEAGERWGMVRLQDYVEPELAEDDEDEDEEDDLEEAA